jgi:hypothetical protein
MRACGVPMVKQTKVVAQFDVVAAIPRLRDRQLAA